MSLSIACTSCGAKVRAPDKAAGRSFKCPKCGDLLRAPSPGLSPPQRSTTPQAVTVNCPHCMTKLSIEADSAGKMASCPMCGGNFPLSVAEGTPNSQSVSNLPSYPRSEEPEKQELEDWEPEQEISLRYDDEPWFYGHLEKYAKSLQSLGYVLAAGCAVLITLGFFWVWGTIFAWIPGSEIGVKMVFGLGWIVSLMWIVAMLRLWLVGVAVILLAVDAARNLRAIKNAAPTAPISK